MASKDDVQKYLDAGIAFTNLTRAKAEELVGDLENSGIFPSGDARAKVDELIERSRKGSELLVAQVQREVTNQLGSIGITSLEDLAREVATLIGRTADAGKSATGSGAKKAGPATKTAAKKAATKKTPAKKTAAKKTPAKKTPAKKTAANKTATAQAPTTKQAPAKKAPTTKKAPAKRAPARKPPTAVAPTNDSGASD